MSSSDAQANSQQNMPRQVQSKVLPCGPGVSLHVHVLKDGFIYLKVRDRTGVEMERERLLSAGSLPKYKAKARIQALPSSLGGRGPYFKKLWSFSAFLRPLARSWIIIGAVRM